MDSSLPEYYKLTVHLRISALVKSELNLKIMERVILTSSNSIPCLIVYIPHDQTQPMKSIWAIWFINYIMIHNLWAMRPSIWLLVRRLIIQFVSLPSIRQWRTATSEHTVRNFKKIPITVRLISDLSARAHVIMYLHCDEFHYWSLQR